VSHKIRESSSVVSLVLLLWMILKTRDTIPSERLVRLVLSHTARE
jgi:hypothetical protein